MSMRHHVNVRLDELSYSCLRAIMKHLNITQSEAIRRSLVFTYAMYIKKMDPVNLLKRIENGDWEVWKDLTEDLPLIKFH